MKYIFSICMLIFFISSCHSDGPVNSRIAPLSTKKIDRVDINGTHVIATITVTTPNPCWQYYRTEASWSDTTYTAKIFGKYDGRPCIQVVGSFTHEEKITFLSSGEKLIRFWTSDDTCLDTLITIP